MTNDAPKYLVPTDFSPGSRQAANTAVSMARALGAEIEFLHVRNVAEFAYGGGMLTGVPDPFYVEPLSPEDVDGMWSRFLARVEGLDDVSWTRRTVIGQPASTIVEAAESLDCDMIVMGATSRTGWTRFLFPDVARQVLRSAPCSVVAVDPAKKDRHAPAASRRPAKPRRTPAWSPVPTYA